MPRLWKSGLPPVSPHKLARAFLGLGWHSPVPLSGMPNALLANSRAGMGRQPNIRPSLHSWPVLGASSAGPSGNNFACNCEIIIHTSKVAPIPVFQVNISLFLTARSMLEDCCALMLSPPPNSLTISWRQRSSALD